jgi:hypothetical protein
VPHNPSDDEPMTVERMRAEANGSGPSGPNGSGPASAGQPAAASEAEITAGHELTLADDRTIQTVPDPVAEAGRAFRAHPTDANFAAFAAELGGWPDDSDRAYMIHSLLKPMIPPDRVAKDYPQIARWLASLMPSPVTQRTAIEVIYQGVADREAAESMLRDAGITGVRDPGSYGEQVRKEADRLRLQRDARALLASEDARRIELPPGQTGAELLALPDVPPAYRVDGLWPQRGNILLAAPPKPKLP